MSFVTRGNQVAKCDLDGRRRGGGGFEIDLWDINPRVGKKYPENGEWGICWAMGGGFLRMCCSRGVAVARD